MKFWYTKLRANPHLTSSGKPYVYIPLVDVDLFTSDRNKSSLKYRVLIDSGADKCLFHGAIGEMLGLDVRSGKKSPMRGIMSKQGDVFYHNVIISLYGQEVESVVGFSYDLDIAFGLLGQVGFFDSFRVCFDLPRRDFNVTPKFAN